MLSSQPSERLKRARISLEGLSVGDALGGFFEFSKPTHFVRTRTVPSATWWYTDDTNMALSVFQILCQYGEIKQVELVDSFVKYYDRLRGYGRGVRTLVSRIRKGENWRNISKNMFGGIGSFGNGGAMRIAPLGAYFGDDFDKVVEQTTLATEITHAHLEAVAGAIAVAIATAYAFRFAEANERPSYQGFISSVLPHVPASMVKDGLNNAYVIGADNVQMAASILGNGSQISAMDTVSFTIWSAGKYVDNFEEAFWQTAGAGGDVDTTCAIVGGIVAGFVGQDGIPEEWLDHREPLSDWAFCEP